MNELPPLADTLLTMLLAADWPVDTHELVRASGARGSDAQQVLVALSAAGLVNRYPGCRGTAAWAPNETHPAVRLRRSQGPSGT